MCLPSDYPAGFEKTGTQGSMYLRFRTGQKFVYRFHMFVQFVFQGSIISDDTKSLSVSCAG